MAIKHGKNDSPDTPYCIIHDCGEVLAEQPSLENRVARCAYFGKPVKTGMYNGNCCGKCTDSVRNGDKLCHCEYPSSTKLWFFQVNPDKEFDTFYCACHGAD
jgi:hypothetical protein